MTTDTAARLAASALLIALIALAAGAASMQPHGDAGVHNDATAPLRSTTLDPGMGRAGGPCGEGAGDCFEPNDSPGCELVECCEAICDIDPGCCFGNWDQGCANLADDFCEVPPACPGSGDCFLPDDEPGCEDEACCRRVCLLDSFCCSNRWDERCAEQAVLLCDDAPACEMNIPPWLPDPEPCQQRDNEGCNAVDGPTSPIDCNVKYTGSVFASGGRDTDWYRLDVEQPTQLTWTVESEFPSLLLIMAGDCHDGLRQVGRAYGGGCEPASVTACVEPGTHYFFVAPGTEAGRLTGGITCAPEPGDHDDTRIAAFGNRYIASLTCEEPCAADCPEDLTGDGQVGGADLGALLAAWGDCPDPGDCAEDLTGDGSVGGADLGALLAAWGDC